MAIWPFIISKLSRKELGELVVNHEKIHFKQQLELLILPFFIFYFVEYFIRFVKGKNRYNAYRAISFEKEAYSHESEIDYVKNRKLFSWVKYL